MVVTKHDMLFRVVAACQLFRMLPVLVHNHRGWERGKEDGNRAGRGNNVEKMGQNGGNEWSGKGSICGSNTAIPFQACSPSRLVQAKLLAQDWLDLFGPTRQISQWEKNVSWKIPLGLRSPQDAMCILAAWLYQVGRESIGLWPNSD